jgi:hypothetical protein
MDGATVTHLRNHMTGARDRLSSQREQGYVDRGTNQAIQMFLFRFTKWNTVTANKKVCAKP